MPIKSLALAVTAASDRSLFSVPVLPQQPAFLAPAQPQMDLPVVPAELLGNMPAIPVQDSYANFPVVPAELQGDMPAIPVQEQYEQVAEEDTMSWSGMGAAVVAVAVFGVAARQVAKAKATSPVAEELAAAMVDHEYRAVEAAQRKLSMLAVEGAAVADEETDTSWRTTYNGKPKSWLRRVFGRLRPTKPVKQDFLEATPYWDQSAVPINTYKNKAPFEAEVVSCERIVGPDAIGETCHIVFKTDGKMPYYEGQSYGVIPPGTNPKNGKPNGVRLYSIASSRYGDDMTGNTASLVVKRATYWCPELQAEDPAKKGICSNYLCDAKPGDKVMLTGPSGKVMLMPEENPNTDYIMIATGTGIAPYRGMIRRLFVEQTPAAEAYKGLAWLFLGVMNEDSILYKEEWDEVKKNHPDQFRVDYALSMTQKKADGSSTYIQDRVAEYGEEVYERMDKGAHLYICGLKGVVAGMNEMFESVCATKGVVWEDKLKEWKKNNQWHVEVY